MKKKWLIGVCAIAILISTVTVKPAVAYFTGTKTIEGSYQISVGHSIPDITEKVEGLTKKIQIRNTGDYDILVRAKAIYPDGCDIEFVPTEGWSDGGDGYYYYANPVSPGDSTPGGDGSLTLNITRKTGETGNFNVVIVQEAAQVIYDKDGNPTANWNAEISNQNSYTLGQ